MANYPQELVEDAVCQSHTGHMSGLWFLPSPARPSRLNTNEWMKSVWLWSWPLTSIKHCGWEWVDLFFIVTPFKLKHMKEYRLHKFFSRFSYYCFTQCIVNISNVSLVYKWVSSAILFYMPGNSAGRRTDGKGVRRLRWTQQHSEHHPEED